MFKLLLTLTISSFLACSTSEFASDAGSSNKSKSKDDSDQNIEVPMQPPTTQPGGIIKFGGGDQDIQVGEDQSCIFDVEGTQETSVLVRGENCINNGVDPGGADFDDYRLTITGEFLRSDWQIFSTKDQTININYELGTPGSTTQVVSMQVVDCLGEKKDSFDVSSGNGNTELKARKGDRFNVVMTVTSGCYGRKDVYDLIKDQNKAFRMP